MSAKLVIYSTIEIHGCLSNIICSLSPLKPQNIHAHKVWKCISIRHNLPNTNVTPNVKFCLLKMPILSTHMKVFIIASQTHACMHIFFLIDS